MAYSYASNSQTSPGFTRNELITAIEDFLTYDASWTVLQEISETAGGSSDSPASSDYSIIQKTNGTPAEDVVVSLWKGANIGGIPTIGLNISTGYTPAANWYDQPGARVGAANFTPYYTKCSHATDDIVEYHLFGYPGYFYCVFKTSSGIWRNFGFGHLDKLSTFVGGGFSCASYSTYGNTYEDDADSGGSTQFFDYYRSSGSGGGSDEPTHCTQFRYDEQDSTLRYAVSASLTFQFLPSNLIYQPNYGWGYSGAINSTYTTFVDGGYVHGFEHDKIRRAPSAFSLTSPLIPIYTYFSSDFVVKYRALVATLPHVFALNIKSLSERQEITVQGETYVVFPYSKKSTAVTDNSDVPNSYYFGFCMLKKIEA